MRFRVEQKLEWHRWVTPVGLREKPVHRWSVFPHSFTDELVASLIEEWQLTSSDRILDPFAGAGTTILTAKQKGVPATGYDLSPFAVLAAEAKVHNYHLGQLKENWSTLFRSIVPEKWNGASHEYPALVKKALPGKLLGAFDAIDRSITRLSCSEAQKRFFRLALLKTIREYSRAVPTGGWLSWIENHRRTSSLKASYEQQVERMLEDLEANDLHSAGDWRVEVADARKIPERGKTFTAVITSPPYPNRHDYTRVFGIELMFGFLDWEGVRALRYQSMESHPEAHPLRPSAPKYETPKRLQSILSEIKPRDKDHRIATLLSGYFKDIYLSLREAARVCKKGAHLAYVVGNAQYFGTEVPVDQLTATIGRQVGLRCEKIVIVRYRGNSAQQMGKFGRHPSRESIVYFTS